MTSLVVPFRFRGPAASGNGGWTAGAFAELLPGPTVEVTLKVPPPLDTPFEVTVEGDTASSEIASARVVDTDLEAVPPVPVEQARAAEASYDGWTSHPFPSCYACGTDREDGLRIFPGLVSSEPRRVAATWTPTEQATGPITVPITWASLDCVGGWAGDLTGRAMVLGRMTARIDQLPEVGQEHVVVGEKLGAEGRKTFTAATLYDGAGRPLARARHIWIEVDVRTFGAL